MIRARWTAEDSDYLRDNYAKLGARACAAHLGRTVIAVQKFAEKHRFLRFRRWTAKEVERLRLNWGSMSLDQISRMLGRPRLSVYHYACKRLRLTAEPPQGVEILGDAAERHGMTRQSLRRVLDWAGVSVRRATVRSRKRGRVGRWLVDSLDVDEAVEAWRETDDLHTVASRLGWTDDVLRRLLVSAMEAGDKRITPPPAKSRLRWRVRRDVAAELVAAHEAKETIVQAAARVGVDRSVLARWLDEAGVRKMNTKFRTDPKAVDRVVQERKSA